MRREGGREREGSTRYIASTSRIGFKFNSQLNFDRRKKDTASHALLAWFTITDRSISCTYTSVRARVRACLIRRDWLDSRRSNSNTCEALYERRVAEETRVIVTNRDCKYLLVGEVVFSFSIPENLDRGGDTGGRTQREPRVAHAFSLSLSLYPPFCNSS